MARRRNRREVARPSKAPDAQLFAAALEENEEHMGEMAAMAVTCEQFGIDEEDGYDLLLAASLLEDDEEAA